MSNKNLVVKIPQNINLDLSSGVLTLKKGSTLVRFSNNVEVETTVDRNISSAISDTGKLLVFVGFGANPSPQGSISFYKVGSGDTLPANGSTYNVFFLTTNRTFYLWNSSQSTFVTWGVVPICIANVTNGYVDNIEYVFNGFGYFGSSLLVYNGVEFSVPSGRDEYGNAVFKTFKADKNMVKNVYNGQYSYLVGEDGIFNDIEFSDNNDYNEVANLFGNGNKCLCFYNNSIFDEMDIIENSKNIDSLSQYANSKNFMKLFNGITYMFNNHKTLEDWYNVVYNLKTASGFGLDIWGKILNQGRQFSYYENGQIENIYLGGAQTIDGISYTAEYMENIYRTVLFLKVLGYINNCTLAGLNSLLQYYFDKKAYVINYGTMEIRYVFEFYLTKIEKSIFTTILPRPTGVLVNFEFLPNGDFFGFFVNGIADPEDQPYSPFDIKPFYR